MVQSLYGKGFRVVHCIKKIAIMLSVPQNHALPRFLQELFDEFCIVN